MATNVDGMEEMLMKNRIKEINNVFKIIFEILDRENKNDD